MWEKMATEVVAAIIGGAILVVLSRLLAQMRKIAILPEKVEELQAQLDGIETGVKHDIKGLTDEVHRFPNAAVNTAKHIVQVHETNCQRKVA